jgi:hypothetical protein
MPDSFNFPIERPGGFGGSETLESGAKPCLHEQIADKMRLPEPAGRQIYATLMRDSFDHED